MSLLTSSSILQKTPEQIISQTEETQNQPASEGSEKIGMSQITSAEGVKVETEVMKTKKTLNMASKTNITFGEVIQRTKAKKKERQLEVKEGASFGTFGKGSLKSGSLVRSFSEKNISFNASSGLAYRENG
jgi:hypothetical protein